MKIPVKPEPTVVFGSIASVELVEGEYGTQVEVRLDPIPPANFQRRWWFKPSSRSNSKWMRFVTSFNKARGRDIESVEEMVGTHVKIAETEKSGEINGEDRTWTEPIVEKIYKSEEELLRDVADEEESYLPFLENVKNLTDPVVIKLLKQLYEEEGEEGFVETVKVMGYDPEIALRAVRNG